MRRAVFVLALGCACGGARVPDPRDAASGYAEAVARQDIDGVWALMSESARKARTRDDVKRVLAGEHVELAEHARGVASKDARVAASAKLRFDDGEVSTLDLRGGRFWIATAGALPGGARTPDEALDQLRRVLARRSYAGLMRLLTPSTRASVEQDLRTLVLGLEHPEALDVQIAGDAASVAVPGGHHVRLRKENGVWRVDDFD